MAGRSRRHRLDRPTRPHRRARQSARTVSRRPLPTLDDILDRVSTEASTWKRIDVLQAICDLTPVQPGFDGAAWARTLEATTDQVIADHLHLDAAHRMGLVRSSDGRSIWVDPNTSHLTHPTVIAQEERILTFALETQDTDPDAVVDRGLCRPGRPASRRRTSRRRPRRPRARGRPGGDRQDHHPGARPSWISSTSNAGRCSGSPPPPRPPGCWRPRPASRADTLAKLLHEWDRPTGPDPTRSACRPGTTLVCDEAGMVGTASLDRLVTLARTQQWRLVLVG